MQGICSANLTNWYENALLRSSIALVGFNVRQSGSEDGVLTAQEAIGLDLRGTQLVVLSACETGIGNVANGEGVYGLRRAFVLAGAASQLTSLWQVSDAGTKDLIVQYYDRLLANQGRSEALRQTQLAFLCSDNYAHPYYWAAFVPSGNWRPLHNPLLMRVICTYRDVSFKQNRLQLIGVRVAAPLAPG